MIAWAGAIALSALLAQADAPIDAFFDEFAEQRDGIANFEARFVQRTVTPDEIFDSVGTIVYLRPRRLIFRYDDPELVYMMDANVAYEYDAELQQLQIFGMEDRPEAEAFFLGFDQNAERLREAYILRLLPPADPAKSAVALELTPRPEEDEEMLFERVILQLRAGDFLPHAIEIVNDAENSVYFEVSEFVVNGELDPDKAQIVLPEGTMVVQDDAFVERVGEGGLRVPGAWIATPSPEVTEVSLPDPPVPPE